MSLENLYKKQLPANAQVISIKPSPSLPKGAVIGSGIGVGRGGSLKGAGGSNGPIKPNASQQPGVGEFIGTGVGVGR